MSKGSDQTAHMRRLFWGFADRTYQIVGNPMPRLIIIVFISSWMKLQLSFMSQQVYVCRSVRTSVRPYV